MYKAQQNPHYLKNTFLDVYLFICSSIQIYSLGSIDVCHRKHILKFVEIVTTKITPAIYCYEKMCFSAVDIMGC